MNENIENKSETIKMAMKIRQWKMNKPGRTIADFSELSGVSERTIYSILSYKGVGNEPNWTRGVRDKILDAVKNN